MKIKGHKRKKKKKKRIYIPKAPRQDETYELIDGNMSFHPSGYCLYYRAWLSEGLMNTHKCRQKQCQRLKEGIWWEDETSGQ